MNNLRATGGVLATEFGARIVATKITRDALESHLRCKTKAFLKLGGHHGQVSDYEALLVADRHKVRSQAIVGLLAKYPESEVARNFALTTAALQAGPLIMLDVTLDDEWLFLVFDGLKRVDGSSKLGDFHYIPMLFYEGRKVGNEQRLLLSIFGLLLSQIQGRLPTDGIVWHGRDGKSRKVRLNPDIRITERTLRDVKEIARSELPPRLILNDHCQVCDFRQRCYDQAVKEDNISLLRGISENEVKQFARKGLFTVTQLAHTFRPRRKGKRQGPGFQQHHHSLQAMAVRDKRIYVFGTPELPTKPVRIYVDMEGDPDKNFVYLIGMIIVRGNTESRHSFWADGKEQETQIFESFLAEVAKYEDSSVFCYGAYERAFLKRLLKQTRRKAIADRVLNALFNVLSVIYGHVYFPTYSNGLKDIGRCLGCSWSEPDASGIQSIVWRKMGVHGKRRVEAEAHDLQLGGLCGAQDGDGSGVRRR